MSIPSPGWYDDGRGITRWWDGAQWTEHVQPPQTPVLVEDGAAEIAALAGPAEPEPSRKSRWWIAAVIAAVVLIGLIVAAVVLVPIALRAITGTVSGGTDAENAAVQSIEDYDTAWNTIDCTLFESVTTPEYRTSIEIADCAAFEERAAGLVATSTGYTTRVTSVDTEDDGTIEVETSETYRERLDDSGNETDDGAQITDEYTYVLIADGDRWVVSAAELQ